MRASCGRRVGPRVDRLDLGRRRSRPGEPRSDPRGREAVGRGRHGHHQPGVAAARPGQWTVNGVARRDDAAAYESLLRGPIPMLDALAAAHAASAAALFTYAQALEQAQQRAGAVLANADTAAAALAAARSNAATAAATTSAGGSTAGGPFGSTFASPPGPMELPQSEVDTNRVAAGESAVASQALLAAQIASEVTQAARTARRR